MMLERLLPLVELSAEAQNGPSVIVLYDPDTKGLNVCVFNAAANRMEVFVGTAEHLDTLQRRLAHLMTCPDCNSNSLAH
jgi:5S rRNA maturation endonuclease (ribonuclease M5)